MSTIILRGVLLLGIGILLGVCAVAAPRPLTDSQLDQVFAAGFDVKIDLGLDVAATNPEAVFVEGNIAALQKVLDQGMTLTHASGGGRNIPTFDQNGTYMPNLNNLTVNTINISENALQNANTMMNIFALQGDVAVGLNLNVVVNPVNSPLTIAQTNINFANLSEAFSTLNLPGGL